MGETHKSASLHLRHEFVEMGGRRLTCAFDRLLEKTGPSALVFAASDRAVCVKFGNVEVSRPRTPVLVRRTKPAQESFEKPCFACRD